MAVKFKDYYDILGVSRTATQDEIKSAYRKLARKYHPDVNKAKDAEDRFKEISEAHEVLHDPEKRQKYDQLGANWRNGQDFNPPPEWNARPTQGRASDFSDFFESLFGGGFGGFGGMRGGGFEADEEIPRRGRTRDFRGDDQEVRIRIPLEDALKGGERTISFEFRERRPDGRVQVTPKTLRVKIPKGVGEGQRIRLAGQGTPGAGSGDAGDLYMVVEIEAPAGIRIDGRELHMELSVAPWEAALGATIIAHAPGGDVSLRIPPNTSSGQKLRLRGKGLPNMRGTDGDLFAEIKIVMPKTFSKREQELWDELAKASTFRPRE